MQRRRGGRTALSRAPALGHLALYFAENITFLSARLGGRWSLLLFLLGPERLSYAPEHQEYDGHQNLHDVEGRQNLHGI